MHKKQLVDQLRQCQRQLGEAPAFVVENLPDDLIIESYITCHGCNTRLVDDSTLEKCIAEANDYHEFLALVNSLGSHSHS